MLTSMMTTSKMRVTPIFLLLCVLSLLTVFLTLFVIDNRNFIKTNNGAEKCTVIPEATAFCSSEALGRISLLDVYGLNYSPSNTSRTLPVIVTAADTSHYLETQGCIKTLDEKLRPRYPDFKLIYYDLGLKPKEREQLQKHCDCEVRSFPFDKYPPHVRQLKVYAFKPIIINLVMQEYGSVCWMDASVRITDDNIVNGLQHLEEHGVVAVVEGGPPGSHLWRTSPLMYKFFNVTPSYYLSYAEIWAGFVMFKKCGVTDFILKLWTTCALVNDCINPPGALIRCHGLNKKITTKDVGRCHRYDQSALNILLWKLIPGAMNRRFHWLKSARDNKVHYFPEN